VERTDVNRESGANLQTRLQKIFQELTIHAISVSLIEIGCIAKLLYDPLRALKSACWPQRNIHQLYRSRSSTRTKSVGRAIPSWAGG